MKKEQNSNPEFKRIFLSLIENTPFGFITIDFKGKILLINERAAQILNLSQSLNLYLDVLITDIFENSSVFNTKIKSCIDTGRKEFDLLHEPFNDKILSVKARILVNGMLITLEDISSAVIAQRQLEEHSMQLETKNKELEQFAYITSHDLQEPLNTIKSFADLIIQDDLNKMSEVMINYLNIISQASDRMSLQIKGLLEHSRIGKANKLSFVDGDTLINGIIQNLSDQITKCDAKIIIKKISSISVYKEEFQSLLQNLITNAIKFRREEVSPIIEIDTEIKAKYITFSVKDNGIGIKEEYHQRIFNMFQRLHNRDIYPGNGIGLSHCKKIVELHGGKIWLNSIPNKGTTFYFTIKK